MLASADNGILQRSVAWSVDEVVERLFSILRGKGTTVFIVVDHSGEAAKAGLQIPNTKLVVFGNPQAGTPVDCTRCRRKHPDQLQLPRLFAAAS